MFYIGVPYDIVEQRECWQHTDVNASTYIGNACICFRELYEKAKLWNQKDVLPTDNPRYCKLFGPIYVKKLKFGTEEVINIGSIKKFKFGMEKIMNMYTG